MKTLKILLQMNKNSCCAVQGNFIGINKHLYQQGEFGNKTFFVPALKNTALHRVDKVFL
jgi:hypothetical protein